MSQRPLAEKPQLSLTKQQWFTFNGTDDDDRELYLMEKEVCARFESETDPNWLKKPFAGEHQDEPAYDSDEITDEESVRSATVTSDEEDDEAMDVDVDTSN